MLILSLWIQYLYSQMYRLLASCDVTTCMCMPDPDGSFFSSMTLMHWMSDRDSFFFSLIFFVACLFFPLYVFPNRKNLILIECIRIASGLFMSSWRRCTHHDRISCHRAPRLPDTQPSIFKTSPLNSIVT